MVSGAPFYTVALCLIAGFVFWLSRAHRLRLVQPLVMGPQMLTQAAL